MTWIAWWIVCAMTTVAMPDVILPDRARRAMRDEARWMVRAARAPRLRTMRQFAEEEIIIPDGDYKGQRFRCDRQPYSGLYFDLVDSGRWPRVNATGPTQSGKTLTSFVCPTLYHLFELRESVICGIPDMEMAGDKFWIDIAPVILRSRYRSQMPIRGHGSRGGRVESVTFRDGQVLKFMSGGKSDKGRAGFTSRVLVVTETDGMDVSGGTSREADKITQLEGRLRSRSKWHQRVYMECTVSIEKGRTWQEYINGTCSRIMLRCPHCRLWSCPERQHVVGWEAAENEVEASRLAEWHCPECGEVWSEADRRQANLDAVVIHRGQEMAPDGTIEGEPVETMTLGFRWSAVNNLFVPAGDIGIDEWRGARAIDEENAEKELRQFVWALPYEPPDIELTVLTEEDVTNRVCDEPRGQLPTDTEFVTIGCDVGKWLLHYTVLAWLKNGSVHVAEYNLLEVDSERLLTERATLIALHQLRDLALKGFAHRTLGRPMIPIQVWIDSGWYGSKDAVYAFCGGDKTRRFRATKGYGATQQFDKFYRAPTKTTTDVRFVGEGFHIARLKKPGILLVHVNADHYKTRVHERLKMDPDEPGVMTIFKDTRQAHTKFRKHLTAEAPRMVFVPERGMVIQWEIRRKQNHWLDATALALAAGAFGQVLQTHSAPKQAQTPSRRFSTPGDQPFLVSER